MYMNTHSWTRAQLKAGLIAYISFFLIIEKMSLLQKWPVLDAVSLEWG